MARLAGELGRPLFGWQRLVVDVALERGRWRWRYPLVTVSVPRQSGKTTLMAVLAIHRCLAGADVEVWYTAQSRQDAVLRWQEMVRLLRRSQLRELPPKLVHAPGSGWDFRVRGGTGNESIQFPNGSAIRVFAPSEDSLHGSVTDLVIIDEARFFDEGRGGALMGGVLPTQATKDGQVWITSTAGGPSSTFLHRELEAGRASLADKGARRCHAEWGIGDTPIDGGDLLERVWAAHPSAGLPGGVHRDALVVAADNRPAWQFANEFGNRWHSEADARLLPEAVWQRSVVDGFPDGPVVFGVDVALDRSSAAIVASVGGVVEFIDQQPFADWVPARIADLLARFAGSECWVDAAGPGMSVAFALKDGGLGDRLTVTSTRELGAACGSFYDGLMADPPLVGHRPSAILDEAVSRARRRPLGQSWVFDRLHAGPALIAMVLAWAGDSRRAAQEASVGPAEAPEVFV